MDSENNKAPDQRFPKSARLLNSREFERVHLGNVFAADAVLVVKGVENGTDETRLGLAVSKRVGNAVVRNRWKRLIREAFRRQRCEMPEGMDLVVRPKRGATCDYHQIFRSMLRLALRIRKNLDRESSERVGKGK